MSEHTAEKDARGNRAVTRAELVEWCERLGHDPNRVSQIILTPTDVTVEYVHPVTDARKDQP